MLKLILLVTLVFFVCVANANDLYSVNVKDYGAKGDGISDDTMAFKKAIDALSKKEHEGKIVNIPAGKYVISDTIELPDFVSLVGEGAKYTYTPVIIIIKEPNFTPIRLRHICGVSGINFKYPNNQSLLNPIEYPPTIELVGINPVIEKCQFDGAWVCISTPKEGANVAGLYKEINGWFHHIGIRIDGSLDIARFVDIHWFTGGDGVTDFENVVKKSYMYNNRIGFQFGRQDGVMMERCFIIWGKTFYEQTEKTVKGEGNHSLPHLINNCWVEDVNNGFVFQGNFGFALNNTQILVKKDGTGIKINTNGTYYNATIDNIQIRGFEELIGVDYNVNTAHVRNNLSITNSQIIDGDPCIKLGDNSERVRIINNHLLAYSQKPAIIIGKEANYITIKDNVLTGDHSNLISSEANSNASIMVSDNHSDTP